MLNIEEFLGSKKAKSMLTTQAGLVAVALGVVWYAGGDPEKVKALMEALQTVLALIAGTGAVHIAGQSVVDARTAGQPPAAAPVPPGPAAPPAAG